MDNKKNTEELITQTFLDSQIKQILDTLLSFYDLNLDLEGILHDIPLKQNESNLSCISRFLESIGFEARLEKVKLLNISNIKIPALVEIDDKSIALVMSKDIFGSERYVFASNENQEDTLINNPYNGNVLYIVPISDDISSYASHMKRRKPLDWFWKPIAKHWGSYYEIIFCSLFINLLVLAIPLFSLNVYDRVIINFAEETLAVLTIGVLFALIFDFIFKTIRAYILEKLTEKLGNEYDFKLMEKLLCTKVSELKLSIGEQANMFRELHSVREFFAGRLVPTLVDLPFIVLFLFIIYLLSPILVSVPIIIIIIIIISNLLVHIPIGRITEDYFAAIQSKSNLLIETLVGMQALKMFGANSNRLFQWDISISKASRASRYNNFIIAFISNFTFTASQICHVFVIFFGVYQIQEGNLTIGGLITCTILSARAIGPVMNFSSLLARLKQSNDILRAIDVFFSLDSNNSKNIHKSTKGPFIGEIQIKDISYKYETQQSHALHKLNLSISSRQHIGLIGKTAAGKSTLAKVIAGLIEPTEGELTLDGFNYKVIPNTELRRSISYAPQDSLFFQGSILYNITLGRDNIDKNDIEEAVFMSGLDVVMNNTSQGLDMEVGEQGVRLSGGQRQAISIARAIVMKPQILVFDEPTTGMDSALEYHVKTKLKDYIKNKTFIMITHRTSLLSLVDRLILLDSGRLIADGDRDEILKKISG